MQYTPAGWLSRFQRDGGTRLLFDPSGKAKDISLSTVDEMSATDKFVPELQRDGEPILVDRDLCVFEKAGWEALYEPRCNGHIPVSDVPLLQQGVPTPLEILLDCDASFRPFRDTSSDDANKTLSATVDGKAHGSGDDTVNELPVFHRDGWDVMTCNGGLLEIKSRL